MSNEGQKIFVKNIGERIKNPELNKTDKQIFANSWIYNTSCRFDVESINGATVQLKSEIDESSLKVGDTVDILSGSTETVLHSNATVATVSTANKQITLDNLVGFTANSTTIYTIRRKLETIPVVALHCFMVMIPSPLMFRMYIRMTLMHTSLQTHYLHMTLVKLL